MQTNQQTSGYIGRIETLLGEAYLALTDINEENFVEKFTSAKLKMQSAIDTKLQNNEKINIYKPSKKIVQMAKLISEKYDNVTKDWANKLKLVQKEIELSQNQKKITIYNR
jgi:hypothetical protein